MIWIDYFAQLFVQALAWCSAIAITVLGAIAVVLVAAKAYAAFIDWQWRRRQARGLSQRIARL